MASIRKKGNKWEVQYRVKGCEQRYSERFDSEDEANFRKVQIEFEMKRGCFEPPKKSIHMLGDVAAKAKQLKVSELMELYINFRGPEMTPRSLAAAEQRTRDYINPIIGKLSIEELTPLTLEAFFMKLAKTKRDKNKKESPTLGPSTIKKCHSDIRAAINWAISREVLPLGCNAATHIKPDTPKEKDVLKRIKSVKRPDIYAKKHIV